MLTVSWWSLDSRVHCSLLSSHSFLVFTFKKKQITLSIFLHEHLTRLQEQIVAYKVVTISHILSLRRNQSVTYLLENSKHGGDKPNNEKMGKDTINPTEGTKDHTATIGKTHSIDNDCTMVILVRDQCFVFWSALLQILSSRFYERLSPASEISIVLIRGRPPTINGHFHAGHSR